MAVHETGERVRVVATRFKREVGIHIGGQKVVRIKLAAYGLEGRGRGEDKGMKSILERRGAMFKIRMAAISKLSPSFICKILIHLGSFTHTTKMLKLMPNKQKRKGKWDRFLHRRWRLQNPP